MKYTRLTLNTNYSTYKEFETGSLNSYTKNKVYHSSGEFLIFVDSDKIEYGKKKLKSAVEKMYKEAIDNLNK